MNQNTSDSEILKQRGFGLSKTSGSSMRPLIWGGSHCVVVSALDDEAQIGDLLMFRMLISGRTVNIVHRLVEICHEKGDTIYLTRGDNRLNCERVRRSDIIGKVVEVHRMGGYRPWHIIGRRKYSVNDPAYQRYVRIWSRIWPVRRILYLMRAHLHGLFTRLGRHHRSHPA